MIEVQGGWDTADYIMYRIRVQSGDLQVVSCSAIRGTA